MALSTFGLGAMSSVLQYKAQAQQAQQQSEYDNKVYTETATNAVTAYRRGVNQLLIRDDQEVEAAALASQQATRQNRAQKSATKNALTAAGLSGTSAEDIYAEYDRLETENQFIIDTNLDMSRSQIRENMEGLRADAQSRIAAAAPRPVSTPSRFAALLNVGASGLAAANQWKTMKALEK
jgi:hypothetical protein